MSALQLWLQNHNRRLTQDAIDEALMEYIAHVEQQRDELAESMRNIFPAAHRLALELEALLLSCNDNAAVSKWWDSAHEALEQWRQYCQESERP